MAKLFALEEAELDSQTVEFETSPEEGEVANDQLETEADINEITENSDAIVEGVEAADQLEEVEEVVEKAAENDGLNPVAAEAIRIAVEAICARIGANSKTIYPLYAVENFQSASSRKANTKIALEGVSEFLKNLWERIKAALKKLWSKVVEFWNKYFSALNNMQKSLISLKEKISTVKGYPSHDQVKVPGSLLSIFPITKKDLSVDTINTFKATLDAAKDEITNKFKIYEETINAASLREIRRIVDSARGSFGKDSKLEITFGSENSPLPGSKYYKWIFKIENENAGKSGVTSYYRLDLDEEINEVTPTDTEVYLDIANKDKLKELVNGALELVKEAIKYRDRAEQRARDVNNSMKAIDAEIEKNVIIGQKIYKSNLRAYNLILSKGPSIELKYKSAFSAYVKGVIKYVNVCLKNYKTY